MKEKWNKLHVMLKIGLITAIVGISPLLIIVGLDKLEFIEAGNAIGPGILAFITFWPSILLIIIGSILTLIKRRKAKILLKKS
ncbi:MAG: hypothetical protein O2790_02660 [Bacteroidetes bacterium]|jgi:hypothetical protein|nr:MAG: hypothetical protein ABR90_07700 [Cryomorphaceae bacterium BACL29 MAG-121220-bin8]MDA1019091.1 hypothetical protein [Bacteroidota bacterium]|tara:strand:- start:43875 stop:44123 length:249 start_codon:yes stop_codon:yes gene_type:complete